MDDIVRPVWDQLTHWWSLYSVTEGHSFGCDHWRWSRSLWGAEHTSSVWYFRGIVKVTHSAAHYPEDRAQRKYFFYQNAALIDGLRFMSRSSNVITHVTLPSIRISFMLQHPLLSSLSSLVLLPHFHSHTTVIPHLFFAPCVISLCPPPPPPSFLVAFPLSPSPPYLHLSVRARRETVVTHCSRILISHFVF